MSLFFSLKVMHDFYLDEVSANNKYEQFNVAQSA